MNELALFAGAGGGILAGHLLGWRTVCAVEWEPYAASVLVARQNDGVLSPFPIWDDVQTFDGRPWRGRVDVISGGFPCQDISAAGKGAGITGEKSGMWFHMARIVGEVRPEYVFVENSPMLCSRGLGTVLGDLAALGYDARWGVLGAADVGAPHQRDRIWIVASLPISNANLQSRSAQPREQQQRASQPQGSGYERLESWANVAHAQSARLERYGSNPRQQEKPKFGDGSALANADSVRKLQPQGSERNQWGRIGDSSCEMAYTTSKGLQGQQRQKHERSRIRFADSGKKISDTSLSDVERQRSVAIGVESEFGNIGDASWWQSEPNVGRVANGVAARVDRLKAIGNGQVPAVAATAWELMK